MSSPFVGMDPYIEACGLWGDFHLRLMTLIADALADTAPERYLIRTNERDYVVYVKEEKDKHAFIPDVSVVTPRKRKADKVGKGGTATAVRQPGGGSSMRAFVPEDYRETFVEIFEATPEHQLVTSIELLSPSNKRLGSEGREKYLRKRHACLTGECHFVEIDLLRGGARMPMYDPWPASPYVLMVARRNSLGRCRVWEGHSDRPLPKIPVPLLEPDADLMLDLQPLIETVYRRSRYAGSIDYSRPLDPPLPPDESAWLAEQLRKKR